MPVITDVQDQRRRRERVSVFLDGAFWCGMRRTTFTDLCLAVGQEMDEAGKLSLEGRVGEGEAVGTAADMLLRRPLSEAMLDERLEDRGYPDGVRALALLRMREGLMLDDRAYAASLCQGRLNAGWSRSQTARRLADDGIEAELAEEALEAAFPEDETESAQASLALRFKAPLGLQEAQRAYRYLRGRGFCHQAAREAIEPLESERGDEDVVEALALLRSRHREAARGDRKADSRALAALSRRGFPFDVSRAAMEALREELEEPS
jgi:regulatory protein